jgi:hypothetical protein
MISDPRFVTDVELGNHIEEPLAGQLESRRLERRFIWNFETPVRPQWNGNIITIEERSAMTKSTSRVRYCDEKTMECRKFAEESSSPGNRGRWNDLAEGWRALAGHKTSRAKPAKAHFAAQSSGLANGSHPRPAPEVGGGSLPTLHLGSLRQDGEAMEAREHG